MQGWRASVAAFLIAVMPVAAAAEDRQAATFDIYLRGVKAAQLGFSAVEDVGRYSAAAKLQTSGLIGWLRTVGYEAQAQGSLRGHDLVPSSYRERRINDEDERSARMAYRNGVPQGRVFDPPQPPREGDIDPATQGGTLDVMSAIYAVFRDKPRDKVCAVDEYLFDGRRRTRIVAGDPRAEGDTIVCDALYRRIAGFSAADMAERQEFPFRLIYEENGNGTWHVTKVEMDTTYGRGSMIRR
jgi:hypothetical protein